jgi:sortase A
VNSSLRVSRRAEKVLLLLGIGLSAFYGGPRLRTTLLARAEIARLQQTKQAAAPGEGRQRTSGSPDFSLWSEKRIAAYQEALKDATQTSLAVLRIAKFGLEVPILEGTGDVVLDHGLGHIIGTAQPGDEGNVGIAGHRDGFFRCLKDIAVGDKIEIEVSDRTDAYIVDRIVIVDPTNVSVLEPREHSSLTLVTCYPFYFVGSAPQRYIVQATRVGRPND